MMQNNDSPNNSSRAVRRKAELRKLLLQRDISKLLAWAKTERGSLRALSSLLFDEDQLVVWRTIEAIGIVAKDIYSKDQERVIKQIRQFLWMMNDESGALCRRAPEAIGEILINVPDLINQFAHLLPSFLWEEPFERGVRFAIYRLVSNRPETTDIFKDAIEQLIVSLDHDDEQIRGYAALALAALSKNYSASAINISGMQKATVPVYDFGTGELHHITIGPPVGSS